MNLYLFDCFGVLMPDIAAEWFHERFGAEEGARRKNLYFKSTDRDGISINIVAQKIARDLDVSEESIWAEWENYATVNSELCNFILDLKKNHRTALITNAPADIEEKILYRLNPQLLFDFIAVSGKCGIAKPDIRIFQFCLNAFSERFDKIFAVDDDIVNLKTASSIGIIPHLYQNSTELISFLRSTL